MKTNGVKRIKNVFCCGHNLLKLTPLSLNIRNYIVSLQRELINT